MLESLQSMLRVARQNGVRRWLVAAACSSTFYCTWASALGLGDITLQSALTEPFRAEIALVDPGDLSEGELSVGLADTQAFAKAGIERVFFLSDLRFTPVLRGNRSYIRVESSKPVSEPYLNFLVQVNRPNGNLLREYTVLLDPPGTVPLSRPEPVSKRQNMVPAQEPVTRPPPALQGKRYTVAQGDTLWGIARRLHEAGGKGSVGELVRGIRALNPGSERLTVGQTLLLPDAASIPSSLAPAPLAADKTAEQLASSVLENQQLQKTLTELQDKVLAQDEMIAGSQKQVIELQTQLAEVKAEPTAPAPAPAAPVVTPVAVAPQAEDPGSSNSWLWMVLAALLLLLAFGLYVRRNRQRDEPSPHPVQPSPQTMVSRVVPAAPGTVAPQTRVEPQLAPTAEARMPQSPARHEASDAADALDGVNIYIAYGRFTEALGILRDAIDKEPQRTDLRVRLLEVLAQQGDAATYAIEEQHLLDTGFDPEAVQAIRARYPKLASAAVAVAIPAASLKPAPLPEVEKAPVTDEFQLNLDDLSMNADWDLVSPFDAVPPAREKQSSSKAPAEPAFASNLKELPEVFEMPDEQFLSDFAEPESNVALGNEVIDDAFLDSFKDDPQLLDIEPATMDFESLEREQVAADKLEQAQGCIQNGDQERAGQLLRELVEEGPESLKQVARSLLASLR